MLVTLILITTKLILLEKDNLEGDHVIQSKNQPFADLKQSFTTIAQRTGFPEFALVSVKRSLNKASL